MFDRPSTLAVLDPTALQETPAVVAQPAQAPRAGVANEGSDFSDWQPDEGWFEEGAADDAAEQAIFSAQQAQVQDQPQKAAPAVDRDRVAPSMTQAQASKGAALFARLKVSQAEIATKSVSLVPQDKVDEAPKAAPADSSSKRMTFRR
jgi:cell pole-organizing protein PopZ